MSRFNHAERRESRDQLRKHFEQAAFEVEIFKLSGADVVKATRKPAEDEVAVRGTRRLVPGAAGIHSKPSDAEHQETAASHGCPKPGTTPDGIGRDGRAHPA